MHLVMPLPIDLTGFVAFASALAETDRCWLSFDAPAWPTFKNRIKELLFTFRVERVAILVNPARDDERFKTPRMIVHRGNVRYRVARIPNVKSDFSAEIQAQHPEALKAPLIRRGIFENCLDELLRDLHGSGPSPLL